MKYKRTLNHLNKDIVLVTRVRIFCTTLFTSNNIKVVIQINAFRTDIITDDLLYITHRASAYLQLHNMTLN